MPINNTSQNQPKISNISTPLISFGCLQPPALILDAPRQPATKGQFFLKYLSIEY